MPWAKRSYRPECSPRPCTTANVISAPGFGQARNTILVPSADSTAPSVASAFSAAKMPEAPKDLERFVLSLEQRRGVGPDAAQRVCPFGARGAPRMKPKCGWVEEDALALNLLDHRPLCQHVLQRLTARQTASYELQAAKLG